MRIAYLSYWNEITPQSGVWRKINTQCSTWISRGHTVAWFNFHRAQLGPRPDSIMPCCTLVPFSSQLQRLRAYGDVCKRISTGAFDVVYLRYDLAVPPLIQLAARVPVCAEMNTSDMGELSASSRTVRERLHRLYSGVTRRSLFKRLAGAVYVTREMMAMPEFSAVGAPRIAIGNSIRLRDIEELPPSKSDRLTAAFLGTAIQGDHPVSWHGQDKLVSLAHHLPEVHFHLIGSPRIPDGHAVPPNLQLHGPLERSQYRQVLAASDVAIGTLALHRIGTSEASPLKVREYLGHGMATVIAYSDTDFPEPQDFLLQIPNTEGGVIESVDQIREFIYRWRGRRVPRASVAHLDSEVKEDVRLKFLSELCRPRP